MPMERARKLWSPRDPGRRPGLEGMNDLFVDWMNGIQFYLRRKVEIVRGHLTFVDAPWALTALTQAQFWDAATSRATTATARRSTASRSTSPTGTRPGSSTASRRSCARTGEIQREVWAQIKAHLEDTGESVLPDDILHSWFLDPAIKWSKKRQRNTNRRAAAGQHGRLLVQAAGRRARRSRTSSSPATTCRPTSTWRRWREPTSPAGRRSTRCSRHRARGQPAVPMFKLYDPPEFEASKRADAELFAAGQPNALDHQ